MTKNPLAAQNKFGVTTAAKGTLRKGRKSIDGVIDALQEEAKACVPCGCDPCTGIEVIINYNTTTSEKEIWGRYYLDGAEVIEDLDTARANVKALGIS